MNPKTEREADQLPFLPSGESTPPEEVAETPPDLPLEEHTPPASPAPKPVRSRSRFVRWALVFLIVFGLGVLTLALLYAAPLQRRAEENADEVEDLMLKCEEIIQGEPTNKREVLQLASRIRAIEEKLGVKRTRAKQI